MKWMARRVAFSSRGIGFGVAAAGIFSLLGASVPEWLAGKRLPGMNVRAEIGVIAGTRRLGLGCLVAPGMPRPNDGVVTVDASDQASLEMLDSSLVQTGIVGTGASLVSLWQAGLLGLKATREINWKLRRAGAARYIISSAYKA